MMIEAIDPKNQLNTEKSRFRRNLSVDQWLPKEMLLRIFSFLDYASLSQCARVSKAWRAVVLDGSLWEHIDFARYNRRIKTNVVESLTKRAGCYLKSINFQNCAFITDEAVSFVGRHCPFTRYLVLKHCKALTNRSLVSLAANCPKLQFLDIGYNDQITDIGLQALCTRCKNIKYLNVSRCGKLTATSLSAIAENLCMLQYLECEGCVGMVSSEKRNIDFAAVSALEWVNFKRCAALHDDLLIGLVNSCPSMKVLLLSHCTGLTDESLIQVGTCCKQLRCLDVSFCPQFTDYGLTTVARGCRDIEKLDLEDCEAITDELLRSIANHCHKLTDLTLSRCDRITDAGLRLIVENKGGAAAGIAAIRVLELDNCSQLTDKAMQIIAAGLSKQKEISLKRLDVFDCARIKPESVKQFKQNFPDVNVHAYFVPHNQSGGAARPRNRTRRNRTGGCICCRTM